MIRNVVLLFGMSLLTVTVRAQQLYVAPNGSDANNGTSPSAPWRTIQKAMNSATPGSTVNIVAGTYNERLTVGVSGTAGNYITFQPYNFSVPSGGCGGYTGVTCGGDQVILDYGYLGTVTDGIPFLDIEGKSYIRIQGLTFQNLTCLGSMQQGVKIASSSNYIDILQNKFLHNQNNGAWDGTNALLHFYVRSPASNITVRGNEFGYIVSNYSETLSLYAITGTVVLENNYLHDLDGIGIDVGSGSSNGTVRGNVLEYVSIKRDGTVWYNSPSNAIYVVGGSNAILERNIVRNSGWGIGVTPEPGYSASTNITIRNNLLYNNTRGGIMVGSWYSTVSSSMINNVNVFNNTAYGNAFGAVLNPATSILWENNIFANNKTAGVYNENSSITGHSFNYNLFYSNGPNTWYNVAHYNDVSANPLFTNPSTGDFSLQSTSPAINVGDPNTTTTVCGTVDFLGNPRIVGGRIDMAAYEYPAGSAPGAPTNLTATVN